MGEMLARISSALDLKWAMDRRKSSYVSDLEEKNRELEQASSAKTQILSTVTHELKTPLTSIINQVYILLRQQEKVGLLNKGQEGRLETIQRNSDRLKNLIDDLLDISRIESNSLVLDLIELDVKLEIEEFVGSMENLISQKQISLVLNIPADLSRVAADQLRFSQVMTRRVALRPSRETPIA